MAKKILVLDFETTGIKAGVDEVLQVAVINGECKPLLHTLCKPQKLTEWPEAQRVHGITPAMVANASPFARYVPLICWLIETADEVLAYNAGFELGFLKAYGIITEKPFIDPMLMFAPVYGEWNDYRQDYRWQKLTTAANYYKYSFDAHDALEDVKATLYVYRKLLVDGVAPVSVGGAA